MNAGFIKVENTILKEQELQIDASQKFQNKTKYIDSLNKHTLPWIKNFKYLLTCDNPSLLPKISKNGKIHWNSSKYILSNGIKKFNTNYQIYEVSKKTDICKIQNNQKEKYEVTLKNTHYNSVLITEINNEEILRNNENEIQKQNVSRISQKILYPSIQPQAKGLKKSDISFRKIQKKINKNIKISRNKYLIKSFSLLNLMNKRLLKEIPRRRSLKYQELNQNQREEINDQKFSKMNSRKIFR